MRALFWKEIRQNLVWAVLLLLAVGGIEGWIVGGSDPANGNYDLAHSVCGGSFLMATSFGYPLVAFLLALLQTGPEKSTDRWALLVHRPLSRSGIFRGKAAAGLALYLVLALVPLLLAAWWTAVPGHVAAPFLPSMLLPGLCDAAVGFVYYFAGLIFNLRPARWFGTKLLPLFAAVEASMMTHFSFDSLFSAGVLLVTGALLLGCLVESARRAFLAYRLDRPATAADRFRLALVFTPAILGLATIGTILVWMPLAAVVQKEEQSYKNLSFDADWNPYWIVNYSKGPRFLRQEAIDLGGHPLSESDEAGRPAPPVSQTLAGFYFNDAYARFTGPGSRRDSQYYAVPCRSDARIYRDDGEGAQWYYLPSLNLYQGFSLRDRRPVGWFGPEGLVPPGKQPPAAPRSHPARNRWYGTLPALIDYDSGVYFLDPERNVVRRIAGAAEREGLTDARLERINPWKEREPVRLGYLVYRDRVVAVTLEGERLATFAFSGWEEMKEPHSTHLLQIGAIPDGNRYRWVTATSSTAPYPRAFWTLRRFDADGNPTQTQTIGDPLAVPSATRRRTFDYAVAAAIPPSIFLAQLPRHGWPIFYHAGKIEYRFFAVIALSFGLTLWLLRRQLAAAGASPGLRLLGALAVVGCGPWIALAFRLTREKPFFPAPAPVPPEREHRDIFEQEPSR